MKVTIEFQQLEHTDSLDERIEEKSQKFKKYFFGETSMRWYCYVREGSHYAEATLKSSHYTYRAKAKSDSLYKSIDKICSKLEKQLVKKKEKVKSKIHKKVDNVIYLDPENAWGDRDLEDLPDHKKAA